MDTMGDYMQSTDIKTSSELKIVCAWCGKEQDGDEDTWKHGPKRDPDSVSHGICPRCADAYLEKLKLKKDLKTLSASAGS